MIWVSLRRVLFALLVGVSGASLACGQSASGMVVDLEGGPAVGATVSCLDTDGVVVCEGLVDRDGRFDLVADQKIAKVVVQREAVWVEQELAKGKVPHLSFDLRREARWTIRGHVVDPGGAMMVAVDILARCAAGKALACVTTDARGAFVLRSNQPIEDLVVAPLGWHHVVQGPFVKERGLAIDLRLHLDEFLLLQGRLLDLAGQPVSGASLHAKIRLGKRELRTCATTKTRRDGTWRLWSPRAVEQLVASHGTDRWARPGNWSLPKGKPIVLDARRDGVVAVRGRLLDAKGDPVARGVIYASDTEQLANDAHGLAGTSPEGYFYVTIRRATPFLVATTSRGKAVVAAKGPWGSDFQTLQPK